MQLDLDIGSGIHVRALAIKDAAMLVDATSRESAAALWGPRPAGPYSLHDAQAALLAWDPAAGGQFSVGILRGQQLLGAVGLMPDHSGSSELAYWIRPEQRGRGIASRAVLATTLWATAASPFPGSGWRSIPATARLSGSPSAPVTTSNSVSPSTAATGCTRMPTTTHGTTVLSGLTSAIEQSSDRIRRRVRCGSAPPGASRLSHHGHRLRTVR